MDHAKATGIIYQVLSIKAELFLTLLLHGKQGLILDPKEAVQTSTFSRLAEQFSHTTVVLLLSLLLSFLFPCLHWMN